MALETVVFQQDPFSYGYKDFHMTMGGMGVAANSSSYWDDSPLSSMANPSAPKNFAGEGICPQEGAPAVVVGARRKRRRTRSSKNKEEMESQRMTHIAVERNRRKLMNDYLAVLRSLMPPSYAQRGDQASIVGGAINFVKELEQLVQFLESHKQLKHHHHPPPPPPPPLYANFFTFPQYSTRSARRDDDSVTDSAVAAAAEKGPTMADIEVTMVETHAHIKILSRKQPKQVLKLVAGFYSLGLAILHLNVTSVDKMVLYSFSVKVGDDCQLNTVNEIANTVHEMMGKIQEEAVSS